MSLYVNESGAAGAPSVVFLHGAGTSGWIWQEQARALGDSFHCLNVDLPGHGKSSAVAWVSLADTAQQVAAIIRERATQRKAHLVGISLGGYVGLHLLAQHTPLITRAVFSGVTGAPLPNKTLLLFQMRLMSYLMKMNWFIDMQAKLLHIPADSMPAYVESIRAMSRKAFLAVADEIFDYHLPQELANAHTPTLIVAGGAEVPAILRSIPQIVGALPNAQGRIAPGLHHGWIGEDPYLFNAMLCAWLTDAPLPAVLQPA